MEYQPHAPQVHKLPNQKKKKQKENNLQKIPYFNKSTQTQITETEKLLQ